MFNLCLSNIYSVYQSAHATLKNIEKRVTFIGAPTLIFFFVSVSCTGKRSANAISGE